MLRVSRLTCGAKLMAQRHSLTSGHRMLYLELLLFPQDLRIKSVRFAEMVCRYKLVNGGYSMKISMSFMHHCYKPASRPNFVQSWGIRPGS
jgi:hypothetical protein